MARERKVSQIFRRTKMCTFNSMRMCNRGDRCVFAHSAEELQPLPDFSCTKLCPELLQHGSCKKPDCHYAHTAIELRKNRLRSGMIFADTCATAGKRASGAEMLRGTTSDIAPGIAAAEEVRSSPASTAASATYESGSIADSGFSRQTTQEVEESHETAMAQLNQAPLLSADTQPRRMRLDKTRFFTDPGFSRTTTDECEDTEGGGSQFRLQVPQSRFHKTRLCRFHAAGRCRKRAACNFAHSVEELHVLPDLTCTTMCPALLGELPLGGSPELAKRDSGPFLVKGLRLTVKNTFLCFEDPEDQDAHSALRRSLSAPPSIRVSAQDLYD